MSFESLHHWVYVVVVDGSGYGVGRGLVRDGDNGFYSLSVFLEGVNVNGYAEIKCIVNQILIRYDISMKSSNVKININDICNLISERFN